MEVGISTTIPADIVEEGSITIPGKKIHDIIKELPEGRIDITVTKNNTVNIKAGKSFFKVMGLGREDFPKLPEFSLNQAIEIEQALVKESLSLTVFAISHDETRYVLNGILISIKNQNLKFVATDGRRLAFYQQKLKKPLNQNIEMIVPVKAIYELLKLLSWEGSVKIIPSNKKAIFCFKDTYLTTNLIEGSFPNYDQVIPKEEKILVKTKREEFSQAVRRAALLTSNEAPALKLDFLKNKILISSKSPNIGEAKEEIPAEVIGGDISIGFNPNYLQDVLKNLDTEEVVISLTTPEKPGVLKGKEGYLYVIMPMQLN